MENGQKKLYVCEESRTIYADEQIVFIENLQDVDRMGFVKLEHFVMIVCLRGHATINIEGSPHDIRPNDALICRPNIILGDSMTSMDFDFRCICLSKDYVQQLPLISNENTWDVLMFFEKSPVLSLTSDEVKDFCLYYDLMR